MCFVGDVHGRLDCLSQLLAVRNRHFPHARLVFLGDLIDRGPDSAGVLAKVREETAGGAVCLMGNHEAMMISALEDPAAQSASWLRHGGFETMASFGLEPRPGIPGLREALGEDTLAWLSGLPLLWQSGNMAAAHAGMDPSLPPSRQSGESLLWGHADFGRRDRADGLWVAHGHFVMERARCSRGRIALDTGAYATGRLSYAVVDPAQPATERVTLAAVSR